MSWLRIPDESELPDEVRSLYEKPLEKLGFVPNVLRAWALRPSHLLRWNGHMDELMRGESGLTKAQREMIAVVVSVTNRCNYCIVSHTAALRKLAGDPVDVYVNGRLVARGEVLVLNDNFCVRVTELLTGDDFE